MKLQITNTKKGFTLLELLFVIGIFSILTSIVIYNYGNFNNNIIVSNLAYEVALEIRQAQVYGLGVRGVSDSYLPSDVDSFNTRYGVFFEVIGGEKNAAFMTFADFYPANFDQDDIDSPDGNGVCNSEEVDDSLCNVSSGICTFECLRVARLSSGITFDKLCVSPEGIDPVDLLSGECAESQVSSAHVTFARPYTNAIIRTDDAEYFEDDKLNIGIVLKSTAGSKRAVVVRESGQITVEMIRNN